MGKNVLFQPTLFISKMIKEMEDTQKYSHFTDRASDRQYGEGLSPRLAKQVVIVRSKMRVL